jgi:hypothetical protein
MNTNGASPIVKQMIVILTLVLLFCSACNFPLSTPTPESSHAEDETEPAETRSTATPISIESTLEKDCIPTLPGTPTQGEAYATVIEPFDLLVSSGNRIYGLIRRPDPARYADLCFPAVVLVPGGINPGRMEAYGQTARALSEAGMVVVTFNAEGRVDASPDDIRSEGTEDYNGFRNQDTLCELVSYTIQLPYVITENVGIKTQSFGITMGAGCAGRHPEIPIKYLVDGEGPPNSFVTCHEPRALDDDPSNDKHETIYGILNHYSIYRDPSPENRAFWEEREAERFIGSFRGRYLRLQAEWDHSQPPDNEAEITIFHLPPLWWQNKHTTDIVNIAVQGGVPWVRVNLLEQGNPVNATYDLDHPPVYLPGKLADKPWDVRAILEMALMP